MIASESLIMEVYKESCKMETNHNKLSLTQKAIVTIFLSVGYIGTGCAFTVPGPSMLDLEIRMGSTTKEISLMFTLRAIGSVLGSLLSGFLYETLSSDVVLFMFYIMGAATISISPWWYHSMGLSLCLGLTGFACAGINVGVNICCIRFWTPKHTSMLVFLAFIKEVGIAAIIPVIGALLLDRGDPGSLIKGNMTLGNSSFQNGLNHSIQYINTTIRTVDFKPEDVKVQYAFFIPAFLFMVAAIYHCLRLISKGCQFKEKKMDQDEKSIRDQHTKNFTRSKVIQLSFIFGILAFATGCITDVSHMFLFSFTVKYINWSKADAALLLTAFSISVCCSPLFFSVISKFSRPPNSLWIANSLQLIMISILCTSFIANSLVLWGTIVFFGLAYGSIESLVPSWMASLLGPSSKWTAFYFGTFYVARTGAGWFVGYLFEEYGPIWFVYFILINVVGFALAQAIGYMLTEVPFCTGNSTKLSYKM